MNYYGERFWIMSLEQNPCIRVRHVTWSAIQYKGALCNIDAP